MLDPGAVYLDHATLSPSLRAVLVAEYRTREIQARALSGGGGAPSAVEVRALVSRIADFAGCSTDEVALMRGAGEGLSLVATALRLQPGDEIVTTTHEHPAALEPWLQQARRTGVVVKPVTLPSPISGAAESVGRLVSTVTPRTRVLAFSHVQYTDGTVMPVKELCQFARERGIVSVVDGAQALGMLNFQLRELGCDLYAANFHKWMAGSPGTGFLYVRPELLERLEPLEPHRLRDLAAAPGATTSTPAASAEGLPNATARLSAVLPYAWPAWSGTSAAIDFHASVRRDRIEARVRELFLYARLRFAQVKNIEILTPNAPGTWGGIFSFRSTRVPAPELVERLRTQSRVVVGAVDWGIGQSAARAAFHVFNTHDEIEKLVQALQRVLT
ncbi:MAG: aminotransferase class V-fold PLP-dependent enzyme [Steroidobacteraceae bacterium]